MKKVEYVKEINDKLFEMRPILIEAGISLENYEMPDDENMDFIYPDTFEQALVWLTAVIADEYQRVLNVKELLPDEIWERYRKWEGFEEHREVVMLNVALRVLRARMAIHCRPDLFCKTKIVEIVRATKAKQKAARKSHPRFLGSDKESSRTAGGAPKSAYSPAE